MTRTLTALYQTRADAQAVCDKLSAAGLGDHVDIHDQSSSSTTGRDDGSFMDKMKDMFGGHDDTHTYAEGVRRGQFLVTAKVDELRATQAAELMDATTAVDIDRSEQSWKAEGWKGAAGATATKTVDGREEEVIPLVEERLVVGKRDVERGGVRVRSYVVEEPVNQSVNLREEHVSVERRPVDRAAGVGDADFRERNIELTERAEEAVVAKDAFVREEVVVRKDATQRTEEIADTVRHTEVEIDDTTGRTREGGVGTSRPV